MQREKAFCPKGMSLESLCKWYCNGNKISPPALVSQLCMRDITDHALCHKYSLAFGCSPCLGLGIYIIRTVSLMSIISPHDDTAVLCRGMPLLFAVSPLINNNFYLVTFYCFYIFSLSGVIYQYLLPLHISMLNFDFSSLPFLSLESHNNLILIIISSALTTFILISVSPSALFSCTLSS